MARIRTIKPEFFTDERIGECSVTARLLFVACWVIADDNGNLERSARQVKAQAFPYDSFDCEPLLVELIDRGLLIEYEVAGKKCLHIRGFGRHQRIDKPSKPRLPLYEDSDSTPELFDEPSRSKGREGKGREGRETRSRAHPAPDDFVLTDDRKRYAEGKGLTGTAEQFDQFLDHHKAKGSQFVDWNAAWQTWVRNGVRFQAKDRGKQRAVRRNPD